MVTFEQLVLDKLEDIQTKQAEHGERLATLEERVPPKRSAALTLGGVSLSGGAVGALLSFLASHWSK
jgi:hypothetical protein